MKWGRGGGLTVREYVIIASATLAGVVAWFALKSDVLAALAWVISYRLLNRGLARDDEPAYDRRDYGADQFPDNYDDTFGALLFEYLERLRKQRGIGPDPSEPDALNDDDESPGGGFIPGGWAG